ncbi:MAG: SDR family NAD(P)-dependent oxidoreductase [Candidatus Tectimicrobiota bacterium]
MAGRERVVAVTGAASGIGRATALGFGRQGAQVALCDRNVAGLEEVAATIRQAGAQARVVELDVVQQTQVSEAIDGIVRAWGRLDVLVNAAGVVRTGQSSVGPILHLAEADWERMLEVNLLGTVYSAQAAARPMIRQRSGRIVNVASIAGAIPRLHAAAYGVSKAGVRMFTKCLALELARYGITVNAVAPGPTDTPMLSQAHDSEADPQRRELLIAGMADTFRLGIPLGKLGTPEDVASAIRYLASEEAHHVTGVIFNVDGMAQLS